MQTTLNEIRSHRPCSEGWTKLLRTLNKTQADDEPVSIVQILDSNGLDDALWCLRAVSGHDREMRLFAVWCARQVEHLLTDQRSRDALNVAERFANGEATREELSAAASSARSAASSAAEAADSARSAADSAAYSAAARSASSARSAAWSAAASSARSAADSAYSARSAASSARSAAWSAAAQEKELRRICAKVAK